MYINDNVYNNRFSNTVKRADRHCLEEQLAMIVGNASLDTLSNNIILADQHTSFPTSQPRVNEFEDPYTSIPQSLLLEFVHRSSLLLLIYTLLSIPLYIVILKLTPIESFSFTLTNTLLFLSMSHTILPTSTATTTIFQLTVSIDFLHSFCIYYDLALQFVLMLAVFWLERHLTKLKAKSKLHYVENYSIEITDLPEMDGYQLLLALHKVVKEKVYGNNGSGVEVDIEASYTQEELEYGEMLKEKEKIEAKVIEDREKKLDNDKNNQGKEVVESVESYNSDFLEHVELPNSLSNTLSNDLLCKLCELTLKIKQTEILQTHKLSSSPKSIWIIFNTRYERYLALQALRPRSLIMQCCSRAKLFDKYVTIIPAPNPTEILWTNLYYPKIKRYIIRCLCLVLAFGCIACTSYLTLFLQSYNPMPWLKPTILLTMSVLLKLFIKQLTLCERHHLTSRHELSLFRKLTLIFYLNSSVLAFVGSFMLRLTEADPLSTSIGVETITRTNMLFTQEWYEFVGVDMMIILLCDLVYKNIRLYVEFVKEVMVRYVGYLWEHREDEGDKVLTEYMREYMGKVEFNLADCAANIVCVMMFGFTIAGCFPTVYPLLAVFLAVCHVTHRRFMRFYCKKTPYSADKIIEASLKFVYFGIIMHFGVVFIGSTERSNIVLILWACCVGLYLLRFIILKNCIIIVHQLGGTWSTEEDCQYVLPLLNRLSQSQIDFKREQLKRRLKQVVQKKEETPLSSYSRVEYNEYEEYLQQRLEVINTVVEAEFLSCMHDRISYLQ